MRVSGEDGQTKKVMQLHRIVHGKNASATFSTHHEASVGVVPDLYGLCTG